MTTAFYLISVLLAGLFCFFSSLNYAHMFQLEGYKPKGYLKWLMQYGFDTVLAAVGMAMLFVLAYLFQATLGEIAGIIVGFALLTAFAALGILSIRKFRVKDAKKPLAYTSRIKRLLTCEGILIAALCCAGYFSGGAITGILVALAPLYVLLANAVNAPIEALIRRHYLRDAQKKLEAYPDLIKIGITGSYGKTSTKFILAAILSEKYSVCVPPSSYNTPMGLTRVIRESLKKEHQVFLAEMGAKHKGDIEELVELVHPRYGIITSVGPQHLETFGDIQTVAATKYELISGLPKDGIAFFPDDAGICKQLYDMTTMEKRLFALEDEGECDLFASDISCGAEGSSFIVRFRDGTSFSATTKLLGKHNILNILGCVAIARELGLSSEQIQAGISKIEPVEHRLQLLPTANGVTVIDDAFNANPAGTRVAMEVLGNFPGRRFVVTPGMVELGEAEAEENKAFGKNMAGVADFVFLIGPRHTRPIYDGLLEAGFDSGHIFVKNSLAEASQEMGKMLMVGDVVLFENDLPDNYNE